ncbi:hypothetical protein ACFZCL_09380 [Streptomyces sp. NPDC008159]|uniref:hypothetical protein n=1 Tax=Streptomyces sp. NPDC008159 TaxID=3364817 RepID=UPI0036E9A6DE
MTGHHRAGPTEFVDAARIDGNTLWGVYRRIMLPMRAPALLSVGVLDALFRRNDVLIAPDRRAARVGDLSVSAAPDR